MIAPSFKALSDRITDPANLITELDEYDAYFHDATEDSGQPSAIVFAENEADVIAVAQFCTENKIPLVPRGAGTGLSGGCVPSPGSLVLSTEHMKKLEIDANGKSARVGPGVITMELLNEAEKFGLTYPPDPASYDESTLGGNVAENAGGLRCKRYGVTRDYITGLRCVTMDGELIETGVFNRNRGFGLGDMFIGAEGTLVIITEIAVKLVAKPGIGDTILAAFDEPKNAAQTVSDITRAGIIPTVMEYLDGDAADCSNQYETTEGLDNAAAILLFETPDENRQEYSKTIESFCHKNNCSYIRVESDPERAEQLWKVRRNLSKAVKEIAEIRISEDVAVPNSNFPIMVDFVANLNRTSPLRINSFGHAGDGNLHVNFLSMSGKASDLDIMEKGILCLLEKAIELGGTLSGEHGIGLAKRKYLPLEYDETTLAYMRKVKSIFDPSDLLNPGKIF